MTDQISDGIIHSSVMQGCPLVMKTVTIFITIRVFPSHRSKDSLVAKTNVLNLGLDEVDRDWKLGERDISLGSPEDDSEPALRGTIVGCLKKFEMDLISGRDKLEVR